MTLFRAKELIGLLPAVAFAALFFYFAPDVMSRQAAAAFGALAFFGFFYFWAGGIMERRRSEGAAEDQVLRIDTLRKANMIIPLVMYFAIGLTD